MSDRTVRELPRALVDRLDRIEQRLRALSLRAWPGAVRTYVDPSTVSPSADGYDDWFVSATLVLPGGRWIVYGECDIQTLPAAFPARPGIVGGLMPSEVDGGAPITLNCDCAQRAWIRTITAPAQFPLTVSADVRHDGEFRITLETRDTSGHPYLIIGPRIKAIPV